MGEHRYFNINSNFIQQTLYSFFFGIVSFSLGYVQLTVPGMDNVTTDFREIPLLISLFYIKSPFFLFVESLITSSSLITFTWGSYFSNFNMHFFSLLFGLWFYKKISSYSIEKYFLGIIWIFYTLVYYTFFLIPILTISDYFGRLRGTIELLPYYISIFEAFRFEMVSSSLVSSIFLVQLELRRALEKHKMDLVGMVNNKTKALEDANDELKIMNENLDLVVKERTQKVHDQFDQLLKYAHHNSHEVRAPLSRMQGLMSIILHEEDIQNKMDLIEKLKISSEELDAVIIEMNQILESEILKEKK